MLSKQAYGKIYFIGAGPGDPELLTIKAAKMLAGADVIITDRLVSEAIITTYAKSDAIIIPVGKQAGKQTSATQKEINELLVQFAATYKKVVRLKGGDTSLYSNILDELLTVNKYAISYEIIPGITALSGASAYAGVPLTARGYADSVRILTYYKNSLIKSDEWKELAGFTDTLVFYMSADTLPDVVHELIAHGANTSTPLLIIEQATTPNQYVHYYTLEEFNNKKVQETFISPSLVIIGKVCRLYKEFAWLSNNNQRDHYFTPLRDYPELIELINEFQNIQHVSRA